jgi:putative peptidoglycan lipid II flippase
LDRENVRLKPRTFLAILIREQILAHLFGAGNFADTYNLAVRVPETTATALSKGTFRRFSPLWAIAVIGVLFAPQLVGIYAWSFKNLPVKFELTVAMTRIVFLLLPILVMGGLNSFVFQSVSALSGWVLAQWLFPSFPEWGFKPIVGMAMGWAVGALAYSTVFMKRGFENPPLNEMTGPTALPIALGMSVILGAMEGTGAVSWLSYGARMTQIVVALVWYWGYDLADSAGLPALATLERNLRRLFALILPVSAVLMGLSLPWVRLFFQYGRFYPEDSTRTASVLALDAVTLIAVLVVQVVAPAMKSRQDARKLLVSGSVAVALSMALGVLLSVKFGFRALALGPAVVGILQGIFLLQSFPGLLKRLSGPFFLQLGISIGIAALCFYGHQALDRLLLEASWTGLLPGISVPLLRSVKLALVLGGAVFAWYFLGRVLKVRDSVEVVDFFAKKLKKKLTPGKT